MYCRAHKQRNPSSDVNACRSRAILPVEKQAHGFNRFPGGTMLGRYSSTDAHRSVKGTTKLEQFNEPSRAKSFHDFRDPNFELLGFRKSLITVVFSM